MDWTSPNGIQTQAVLTNNNAYPNNADSTVRTRYGRLAWTSIPTSTIVNEARFGWFKDRLYDPYNPASDSRADGQAGYYRQRHRRGRGHRLRSPESIGAALPVSDNLSWNLGKHALKFGVDYHLHAGLHETAPAGVRHVHLRQLRELSRSTSAAFVPRQGWGTTTASCSGSAIA